MTDSKIHGHGVDSARNLFYGKNYPETLIPVTFRHRNFRRKLEILVKCFQQKDSTGKVEWKWVFWSENKIVLQIWWCQRLVSLNFNVYWYDSICSTLKVFPPEIHVSGRRWKFPPLGKILNFSTETEITVDTLLQTVWVSKQLGNLKKNKNMQLHE